MEGLQLNGVKLRSKTEEVFGLLIQLIHRKKGRDNYKNKLKMHLSE